VGLTILASVRQVFFGIHKCVWVSDHSSHTSSQRSVWSENQCCVQLFYLMRLLLLIVDGEKRSNLVQRSFLYRVILATVAPPVTPVSCPNGSLLSIVNPTSTPFPNYTPYSYAWTANGSSALLSFFFRHDPRGWLLDDITVYDGMTQLINNGGFENGDLTGWNYSGRCNFLIGDTYRNSRLAKKGDWYYYDPCRDYGDTISQTFPTVAGNTYIISFWLSNRGCCSPTEIATITIT
jgi:hypothetical protein